MTRLPRWWMFATLVALPAKGQDSVFSQREIPVVASPGKAAELAFAAGEKVVDFDVWPTGAAAVIIVRDASGVMRVVAWQAGEASTSPMLQLPAGFDARAIACHPAMREFFISGKRDGKSVILAVEWQGGAWHSRQVFETTRDLRRLVAGPRPFQTADGLQYRLFFAARLPNGSFSTRSITETGKLEYQVTGPASGVVKVTSRDDIQPANVVAASALPASFHPAGQVMLWQDARDCFHQLPYVDKDWGKAAAVPGNPCGGSLTVTPNGAGFLHWIPRQPGVALIMDHGKAISRQAMDYIFTATPSSVPDGAGVIGVVADGATTKIVYAPISVPLPDVLNAWMFIEAPSDQSLFSKNAGLLRPRAKDNQLFELYDSEAYVCGGYDVATPTRPYLVTTDIFWEVFAAAYEGTFIVQEKRQAIPAFWEFVNAVNAALKTTAPGTPWAQAFSALAEVRGVPGSPEAKRIATALTPQVSPAFGKSFDFGELKPRGHYTTTAEMSKYFRAVHYLTQLGAVVDPAPLASLPADVKQKALRWTSVYAPYIAPSRAPLVWTTQASAIPDYTGHPTKTAAVFPLSWGFDNEVMLSTVFHGDWPAELQITGPTGPRTLPSGPDIAAALGSSFARSVLAPDLAKYPPLGPALDALAFRSPRDKQSENMYDQWMNALAIEWADSAAMPGTLKGGQLWPAKRLQTGLASWATLRHATVLVNERTGAECGEGGFEEIVLRPPRGYVEPSPKAFDAIAALFDRVARNVSGSGDFGGGGSSITGGDSAEPLRTGILHRLAESAAKARVFKAIAEKELRDEELTDRDYEEILYVGRVAEHHFLVYKSLANTDLALANPDPMMKVADVAGGGPVPLLEAAVGRPLEWDQIIPYYGRREIVKGSVYSYYEFPARAPLEDREWRAVVDHVSRPAWIQQFLSAKELSCPAAPPF